MGKRIATGAYQALRESLATSTWFKSAFKSQISSLLRDAPELLAGLDLKLTKRQIADQLVDHLQSHERQYQELTLGLMVELASLTTFRDIERISNPADRRLRLDQARNAREDLRRWTATYSAAIDDMERSAHARRQARERDLQRVRLTDELAHLRSQFLALHGPTIDPRQRGYSLEKLLTSLFALYDLEPHLAYSSGSDQIDGSVSVDTDTYLVEAKWTAEKTGRSEGDIFAAKINRHSRNTLGVFISMAGFSQPFLDTYAFSSPFITFTGQDLALALEGHTSIPEAFKAKKRHLDDTGSCEYHLTGIS